MDFGLQQFNANDEASESDSNSDSECDLLASEMGSSTTGLNSLVLGSLRHPWQLDSAGKVCFYNFDALYSFKSSIGHEQTCNSCSVLNENEILFVCEIEYETRPDDPVMPTRNDTEVVYRYNLKENLANVLSSHESVYCITTKLGFTGLCGFGTIYLYEHALGIPYTLERNPELEMVEVFAQMLNHVDIVLADEKYYLCTLFNNCKILLYEINKENYTYKPICLLRTSRSPNCGEFSPDGKFFLTVNDDGYYYLYTFVKGEFKLFTTDRICAGLTSSRGPQYCAWSHDSRYFAITTETGFVGWWNVNAERLGKFERRGTKFYKILFSGNEDLLVAVSKNSVYLLPISNFYSELVQIINIKKLYFQHAPRVKKKLKESGPEDNAEKPKEAIRITGLAFSPDYKKLIVSSSHALFDFGICRVPSLVDMCTVFLVDNKEKYFADLDFDDIFPDEMLLKINFLNEKNHKKIRFLRDCDSEKEEI